MAIDLSHQSSVQRWPVQVDCGSYGGGVEAPHSIPANGHIRLRVLLTGIPSAVLVCSLDQDQASGGDAEADRHRRGILLGCVPAPGVVGAGKLDHYQAMRPP